MKNFTALILLVGCFISGIGLRAQTTVDGSYLKEMPPNDRVLAVIKGTNSMDTDARKVAALYQLRIIMRTMMPNARLLRNELTPEEMRIYASYEEAARKIEAAKSDEWGRLFDNQGKQIRQGKSPQLAEWKRLWKTYEADAAYQQEILKTFFSPEWQASYTAAKNLEDNQKAQWEQQSQLKETQRAASKQVATRRQLEQLLLPALILGYVLFVVFILWLSSKGTKRITTKITGEIEALGQSILLGDEGVRYSTIKFRTDDGKPVILTKVLAGNDINSELYPGASGVFVFYPGFNSIVLCGCNNGGGDVIGSPDLDTGARQSRFARIMGIVLCLTVCGSPIGFFLILAFRSQRPSSQVIAQALSE